MKEGGRTAIARRAGLGLCYPPRYHAQSSALQHQPAPTTTGALTSAQRRQAGIRAVGTMAADCQKESASWALWWVRGCCVLYRIL